MPEGSIAPQLRFHYTDSPDGRFGWRSFFWPGAPAPTRKLICLPFSGGAGSAFRPLARALGPAWAVTAVDLPGHPLGCTHLPFDDMQDILQCLGRQLPEGLFAGALILGCSLGGYLALSLIDRGFTPGVRGLALAGTLPYQDRAAAVHLSELKGEALQAKLVELGGVPAHVNERLMKSRAHVVQADLQANDRAPPPREPLTIPALVMGGEDDSYCRPELLPDWLAHLPRAELRVLPGPHIFVTVEAEAVAAELRAFWTRLD